MSRFLKFIHNHHTNKVEDEKKSLTHPGKKKGKQEQESAIVEWYYENIPYSFRSWLASSLKQRVDKIWSLDDEVTIDATIENIEFFIRNKQMTKLEKRERVSGVLRATGVRGSHAFTDEMFTQLEIFVLDSEENKNNRRQSKQIQRESFHGSPVKRQRSKSIF